MPHPPSLQERLTELEVQLSHVQRLYEQLNDVVTEQTMAADRAQRRVEELERQVRRLKEKVQEPEDPLDEKPPHY
ncbi:MAG: SlyX family protein [Pirellulales bacterium]|nr:SlyX family protein [Pirellulales bacterium]